MHSESNEHGWDVYCMNPVQLPDLNGLWASSRVTTTLYSFCSQSGCADGNGPKGLVQGTDGDFYGTTGIGGASGLGIVFRITPSGTFTTLHSFSGTDGGLPFSGLVQASDGYFYGTTSESGANGFGTVFKITRGGTLTTLYNFAGYPTDGAYPSAALVQGTDGDFYSTTGAGGANPGEFGFGAGAIFKVTPSGAETMLYSFCSQSNCPDGDATSAALVQDTNGELYGTASIGGAGNHGTLFRLSVGLGPFVETQTTSGKVGAAVKILGTDLTGASSVSFHGAAAVFTVVSPSLITTTVPAGATTGKVEVLTPGGTLSSNVPFRVR